MTAISELSVRRASDRPKMLQQVLAVVSACGANASVRPDFGEPESSSNVQVDITAPGGLQVTVTLSKKMAQPNVFVLSWNMALDSENKLSNGVFGGNVNPHHKRKATYIANGLADLCEKLSRGLLLAKSGDAYLKGDHEAN